MLYLLGLMMLTRTSAPPAEMRPIAEYLMNEEEEVALALSAAPTTVTAGAGVWVLRASGYVKQREGAPGSFTCLVQRGWSSPLEKRASEDFFDPRLKAPICYNASASRTIMREYLRRTELLLGGKTGDQMRAVILEEIATGKLVPPVAPAIAYMMSAGQWIGRGVAEWHPHLMLYLPFATTAAVGGEHGIESGLPLPFDHVGGPFATFVLEARHFVPAPRQ